MGNLCSSDADASFDRRQAYEIKPTTATDAPLKPWRPLHDNRPQPSTTTGSSSTPNTGNTNGEAANVGAVDSGVRLSVAPPPLAQAPTGVVQAAYPDDTIIDPIDADGPHPPFCWTRGKLIGAGAFGRVFTGLNNQTGELFAVKQVALTREEALKGRVAEHVSALELEVAVLRTLHNENIVQYLGTERTDECLNIFLEYVPGGSIAGMIEKFGPLQVGLARSQLWPLSRQPFICLHNHPDGLSSSDWKTSSPQHGNHCAHVNIIAAQTALSVDTVMLKYLHVPI